MSYTGISYQIKRGDTLSSIAAKYLGSANEWPRLYEFNNRAEVLCTGVKRIVNPDQIYAGAKLCLPILKNSIGVSPQGSNLPKPATFITKLNDQLSQISMPYSTAYDIKRQLIELDFGSYVARITMAGRTVVTLGKPIPLTAVSNGTFEANVQSQSNNAFTNLMSDTQVSYDPKTNQINFSNSMIASATNIPGPKYGVAIEMSSTSAMPVLKTEIAYPEIKGKVGTDSYVTTNFKVEIEIEPKIQTPPANEPQQRLEGQRKDGWWQTIKSASVKGLAVVVIASVAYGISVYFSGGGTMAAGPAYASAMGAILIGGSAVAINVETSSEKGAF